MARLWLVGSKVLPLILRDRRCVFSLLFYLDEPTVFSGRAASAASAAPVADASPFSTVGGALAPVDALASLFAGRL